MNDTIPVLDPLLDAIADRVVQRIGAAFGSPSSAPPPPSSGEVHAAYCARIGSEPFVPETHKWDPWHGPDLGAWIPGDAPFGLPPSE